jgi:L,D-transpeptidase YcbB
MTKHAKRQRVTRPLLASILVCICAAPAHAQNTQEEIKHRIETMRSLGSIEIHGLTITHSDILAGIYERRAFVPLWSDEDRRTALREAIARVAFDGLDPAHYRLQDLAAHARLGADPAERAGDDLLHTWALLRVATDLRHGRIDSRTGAVRRIPDTDEAAVEMFAITVISPDSAAELMRPSHFVYRGMAAALERLMHRRDRGGWPVVPAVRMQAGMTDTAVLALRRRLRAEGDLRSEMDTLSLIFDDSLDAAVRSFQHRHALNPDGVVGPATHRELAVTADDRIDQLRVNLERARWLARDLADPFVAVNVAGALVYYVRDGVALFESRAVVGQPFTQTPIFTAGMRYIDLNPTWTVPPGIVHEVLAAIRRNPSYLRTQSMRVLDRNGRTLNPAQIDFSRYSGRTFPYVFRQDPGPLNPLGVVKFVFPNRHNVYLHDTPARDLFEREQRTFSHGCIRVADPLRLAELVLDDPAWTVARLREASAAGNTRSIPLRRTLPVHILYWTASTDLHGELHFYRDTYRRDAPLLRALADPGGTQ